MSVCAAREPMSAFVRRSCPARRDHDLRVKKKVAIIAKPSQKPKPPCAKRKRHSVSEIAYWGMRGAVLVLYLTPGLGYVPE
eukprot:1363925-Prymnesium_polylepis.2